MPVPVSALVAAHFHLEGVSSSGAPRFDLVMRTDTPASMKRVRPYGRRPARVFINYRNGDEPYGAVLVDTALCARFGSEVVFRASRSIRPGEDFAEAILGAVRESSVLLVVIGPRWLDAVDAHGRPRLHDPADWVRREILQAFESGVRVVPVLLNADLPQARQLPPALARLSGQQYLRLHYRYAPADLERLVDEVERLLRRAPR